MRTLRTAASRSGRCSIPNRQRSGMPRIWSGWSPGPRVRICWRRMWRNCWRRPRRRRGFSVSVKSALGRWGWRGFRPKDTSWRSRICRTPAIWGRSCARRRHWGFPACCWRETAAMCIVRRCSAPVWGQCSAFRSARWSAWRMRRQRSGRSVLRSMPLCRIGRQSGLRSSPLKSLPSLRWATKGTGWKRRQWPRADKR